MIVIRYQSRLSRGKTGFVASRVLVAGAIALSLWPMVAAAQLVEALVPVPTVPAEPEVVPVTVEPPRDTTVLTRPRPETDPQGLRLGSFFLFPRAEVDETYNDNIFATPTQNTSDFTTVLAPSFDLLSNWNQDALNFHASGAFGNYASHSSENYRDASVTADGRFDIDEGKKAYGDLQFSKLHESRYSPNSPGSAADPVKYLTYGGALGYAQSGLRVGYSTDFSLNRYEYEAPPRIGGGFVPQSDRNMTTPDFAVRGSYEFVENIQAYVRGEGNVRAYDHGADLTNPNRSSVGYRIDTGLHADLTGVVVADVYVGYLEQIYRNQIYSPLRGIDLGAKLTWNPTTLDTVRFGVDRTVQDLNDAVLAPGQVSPGYLDTVVSLTEDHELLRNLILSANANYVNDSFQGINRTDNTYGLGAGAKYLMNPFLYLGFSYNYAHRRSSGAQATTPYTDNLVMMRLSTQY
jgi:hypothetical protein